MVKIVLVHPDLGIGGAERLVVDAAVALKEHHEVTIYTAHHDPKHCFPETVDGTLTVHCIGDWLPTSLLGQCAALCAYIRVIYLAIYIRIFVSYDVALVDQVSACVPLLKGANKKVIFYCHFPDMLLTTRVGLLKKSYRYLLDSLEEYTTSKAHKVLVNSNFTSEVYKNTFKSIRKEPQVLYPSLNFKKFDDCPILSIKDLNLPVTDFDAFFLSVNRFERKKNLPLGLHAFSNFVKTSKSTKNLHLIMAGGYDPLNGENISHYSELQKLISKLSLEKHITLLKSPDEQTKVNLLRHAECLIYTPDQEHFGIVPVEAMYCGTPVIAVNSGGPMETVIHQETGYLCDNTPEKFSVAMSDILHESKSMGRAGKQRVIEHFSFDAFSQSLHSIVENVMHSKSS